MNISEAIKHLNEKKKDFESIREKAEYIEKAELIKKLCLETAVGYCSPTIKTIKEFPVADVQPVNQWISVEDKLPIEQGPVLCYARSTTGEGNYRILGTLRNGEFWFLQVDGTQLSFPCLHLKVTHWMPLPDPPVDGGNEDENT